MIDPDEMLASARDEEIGALVDAVRLHCIWLRQLEHRLREAHLDLEADLARDGRAVLSRKADACLTTTARIDTG